MIANQQALHKDMQLNNMINAGQTLILEGIQDGLDDVNSNIRVQTEIIQWGVEVISEQLGNQVQAMSQGFNSIQDSLDRNFQINSYQTMNKAWHIAITSRIGEEANRFLEWKNPEWLADALQTGIFIAPPEYARLALPADLVEISDEPPVPSNKNIWIRFLAVWAPIFVLLLILGWQIFPTIDFRGETVLNQFLIWIALLGAPAAGIWFARQPGKKRKQWEKENAGLQGKIAEFEESQSQNELAFNVAMDQRAIENSHARQEMIAYLQDFLGFNPEANYTHTWADENTKETYIHLWNLVTNAQQNPPERTQQVEFPELSFDPTLYQYSVVQNLEPLRQTLNRNHANGRS